MEDDGIQAYTKALNFKANKPACPGVRLDTILSTFVVEDIVAAGLFIYSESGMNQGWIRLYRKCMDSAIWDNLKTWRVAETCLLLANHKPQKWYNELAGKEEIIRTGEFITSRKKLAGRAKLSTQEIRTALHNLESGHHFLTSQSTNRFTRISIINWDIYQGEKELTNQANNQPLTSHQPATNQLLTTNKNDKNAKNEKNEEEVVRSAKASRTTNPDVKIFIDWYFNEYQKILGSKYVVQGAKDATAVKRLLGSLSLDELKTRAGRFLESQDEFILKTGKSISMLANQINKFGDKKKRSGLPPGVQSGIREYLEDKKNAEP